MTSVIYVFKKCCDSNCRLTPGSSCSPSQGSCCESDCSFSQPNKICSQNSDCKSSNLCTGNIAICPPSSSISPSILLRIIKII